MDITKGKRLFTRDGRRVGNGIVAELVNTSFKVITDFGNEMVLSESELDELYYLDHEPDPGPVEHSLEEWIAARRRLVLQLRVGDRIKLLAMPGDPYPVPAGTTGTVTQLGIWMPSAQGKARQVFVAWDTDRSLILIEGIDKYEIIYESPSSSN